MTIITHSKVIIGMGEVVRREQDGAVFLSEHIGYNVKGQEEHEVSEIPNEVEPYKYCYTSEQGFYLNPDWIEPEQLYTLDEAAEIIAKEASANGYDA